ncbi:hypothetical protein C2845_PM05G23110 [Panicum miliaceum]|uniref:Uncharacterized protein n=1 Tax=Panicum miliaceum TaxID=4540 RepID=A0A3L6T0T0_PANMI|nr:hypothetical protein C2845_PM05G23110 [Panicum miliaceum]
MAGHIQLLFFSAAWALLLWAQCVSTLRFTRGDFPDGFAFGAGTAAYQYEGAAAEGGRSPSIWDTYTHSERNMDGGTGDIASDGYHKYKEDVKLMSDIGLEAYRFTISWSRLIPGRRGAVNPKGLQFYNNLINDLVKEGIQIDAVLYHMDLPQILEDEYGGWISPKIIQDFTAYANVCFHEFGDRVAHWTTMLEPNAMAQGGYDNGGLPPNHCSYPFGSNCTVGNSTVEPYLFVHHSLLAHASTVSLYRQKYKAAQKGIVGLNLYTMWLYPFTDSKIDIEATERAKTFLYGWILHPLVFGDYPETMRKIAGFRLPSFSSYESELVTHAFDFIGLNHYTSSYTSSRPNTTEGTLKDFTADLVTLFRGTKDAPPTATILPGKMVDPHGLELILEYFQEKYGNLTFYIQENGYGGTDGTLNDLERIDYLTKYIAGTLKAIRKGADVRGYSVWSFMDLYEIFGGFKTHYGLVAVDFDTEERRRQPRHSAHWLTLADSL